MKEEIFEPLGMKDTAFWVPKEKQGRLAKSYETVEKENGGKELVLYTGDNLAVRNDMAVPPAYEAGGAGLVSTLDDYSRFAAMLLNEGSLDGVQILKPKTVEFFRSGELLPAQQDSFPELGWTGRVQLWESYESVQESAPVRHDDAKGRVWLGRLAWSVFC